MNVKRVSTAFLRVVIFLAGITILALCLFLVPPMANFASKLYPTFSLMKYLIFIVMYGAAVAFTLRSISLLIFYGTLTRTQRSRNYLKGR